MQGQLDQLDETLAEEVERLEGLINENTKKLNH